MGLEDEGELVVHDLRLYLYNFCEERPQASNSEMEGREVRDSLLVARDDSSHAIWCGNTAVSLQLHRLTQTINTNLQTIHSSLRPGSATMDAFVTSARAGAGDAIASFISEQRETLESMRTTCTHGLRTALQGEAQ